MKKLCLILLACLPLAAVAQIYTWKDENGNVHYGDAKNKPQQVKAKEVSLKINTYKSVSVEKSGWRTDKVVMYSTAWCGFCKKARAYFQQNNIAFTEYDIEKDKAAKRRYKKLGATGVPVILYKNQRMNGFNESRFEQMYQVGNKKEES